MCKERVVESCQRDYLSCVFSFTYRRGLCWGGAHWRRLLVGITEDSIPSPPQQGLPSCLHMLIPLLYGIDLLPFSDEGGLPQFTGNSKIFAAAHKGLGFGSLCLIQ